MTAEARSVIANSSRIEGDIKLGRSERHNVVVLGVTALGVGALALGMLAGFSVGDGANTLAYTDSGTGPPATVVEEITSASTDEQFASFVADRSDGFVTLERNDCGLSGQAAGIITAPGIVITTAGALTLDSTPVVIGSDGTPFNGTVLGVSRENDIAVVRVDGLVGTPHVLGTAGPIRSGASLIGISLEAIGVTGTEIEVADIRRPLGYVESLSFVDGDRLSPGAAITTAAGALVAVANSDGTGARTIDQIRPAISEIITNPDLPASQCPPPPEPEEDDGADDTIDGDGSADGEGTAPPD